MNCLTARGAGVDRFLVDKVPSAQEFKGQFELIVDWQAACGLSQLGMPIEQLPQECHPLRSRSLRQDRKTEGAVKREQRGLPARPPASLVDWAYIGFRARSLHELGLVWDRRAVRRACDS